MLAGVKELAELYDHFTLDQYGVIHDGRNAYPGAADCLKCLHEAGKRVVILSNYAGRAALQHARLAEIGLDPNHVDGVVTSGELAYRYLSERDPSLGRRVLWIAWADREGRGLASFFDGLDGYTFAASAADADFILVQGVESFFAGTEAETTTNYERDGDAAPFREMLLEAVERGLPLICANPDLRVVRPWGLAYLGGSLAKYYEELGGTAVYFGKPHLPAFEEAQRVLAYSGPRADICHVGDSLHHDIDGATAAGLSTSFVVKPGLHSEALPDKPTVDDVNALCKEEDVPLPTTVVPRFTW